mgnify:CR=1 FL=1
MLSDEILRDFDGRNVVVTGGTGMVGRAVVEILVNAGAKVRVVSLDRIAAAAGAEFVFGDLCDFGFCKSVTADADYVFHIAGIKGSIEVTKSRPATFFVPLLMMNTNLLEACRINKVRKAVYTSSIGAYAAGEVLTESASLDEDFKGPPMDTYPGWAKRMAELQVQAYGIEHGTNNIAVVRLCNVYGPGDNFDPDNAMVVPSLMARIRAGERPLRIWGDGSAIRDFAYSVDVAKGVILALHHGTGGGYVNLASGAGISIRQLVETLAQVTPFEYEFDASKPAGFPRRIMDVTLAGKMLGYHPETSLHDGLRATWDWYLANEKEYLARQNYFAEVAR